MVQSSQGAGRQRKKMARLCLVVVLISFLYSTSYVNGEAPKQPEPEPIITGPTIRIKEGQVQGRILKSRGGRDIYAFLGMPHSKPPVGSRRFKYPDLPDPWEGVRDATFEREFCAQLTYPERKYKGKEDCLYINVYTPQLPNTTDFESIVGALDVIVFIHEGYFQFGDGDLSSYGPDFLLDHDVVFVTFNYRLGPLGFLATGDEELPGNYGLKDQSNALRWVRRNIKYFNGDFNSITLMGAQAGAASAHYHMFSGTSERRFHGVIALSGTALSPWAFVKPEEAKRRAFRLGELVGCRKNDLKSTKGLANCLKKKEAEEMIRKIPTILDWGTDLTAPFVPTIEPVSNQRPFIYDTVENMIKILGKRSKQDQVPFLIGTTSHEGLPQSLMMMIFRKMLGELNKKPRKYVPLYLPLQIEGSKTKEEVIAHRIWKYYMQDFVVNMGTISGLIDMTSDYITLYGITKTVELHSEYTSTPMYVYEYAARRRNNSRALGVPQGDDILVMFPDIIGGKKINFTEGDLFYADKLLRIIVNFAKEGDPAYDHFPELDNIEWPKAHGRKFSFLKIEKEMKIEEGGLYPERMQFWDKIAEQLKANDSEFEGLDLFEDKPELEDEEQLYESDENIDAEGNSNNLEEDSGGKETAEASGADSSETKQKSSTSNTIEETEDQIQSPESVKDEL